MQAPVPGHLSQLLTPKSPTAKWHRFPTTACFRWHGAFVRQTPGVTLASARRTRELSCPGGPASRSGACTGSLCSGIRLPTICSREGREFASRFPGQRETPGFASVMRQNALVELPLGVKHRPGYGLGISGVQAELALLSLAIALLPRLAGLTACCGATDLPGLGGPTGISEGAMSWASTAVTCRECLRLA